MHFTNIIQWGYGEGNGNPLPGEVHGQRSLAGCSPRGHKESDTSERLSFTHNALIMDFRISDLSLILVSTT